MTTQYISSYSPKYISGNFPAGPGVGVLFFGRAPSSDIYSDEDLVEMHIARYQKGVICVQFAGHIKMDAALNYFFLGSKKLQEKWWEIIVGNKCDSTIVTLDNQTASGIDIVFGNTKKPPTFHGREVVEILGVAKSLAQELGLPDDLRYSTFIGSRTNRMM